MPKSIGLPGAGKPRKPRPDFPLFPHSSGRWCKKVRSKFVYFGKVSDDTDGQKALALWLEQKDMLLAGRVPRRRREDDVTLEDLCDFFMSAKERARNNGELTPRSFAEYYGTCQRLLNHFGTSRIVDEENLTTEEFGKYRSELQKTRGPSALASEIIRSRMVFKFGFDERHLKTPIRFGQSFSVPKRKDFRQAEAARGPKMFEAEELRSILADLEPRDPVQHAIVLLAINAGYGQNDISSIPQTALDLKRGWVNFPRPKTGLPRRAKLWPETIAAIENAVPLRPAPKSNEHAGLAFLTRKGEPWVRHIEEMLASENENEEDSTLWKSRIDSLGKVFNLTLKRLGIGGKRGFYGIRHSFQTAGDRSKDEGAVKFCMGHIDETMSARYRGKPPEDERLVAVANAVREWLFGNSPQLPVARSSAAASSTV